ncbi:MAG: PqqD family protein [Paludibacteraceae bacterium]|nr:PqqD family protein [Paludibacteraceae bacterium]
MKTIEGFRLRKLGNEYILVGESMALINFNKMITLNETAAFLWQKAEECTAAGGFSAADLCKALCAEYDVSPEQAMSDVNATVASWREAGIIE